MQRKVTKLRKGNTIIEVNGIKIPENLEMQTMDLTSIDDGGKANKKEPRASRLKRQEKRWNSEKAEKIAWILMAIATALSTISLIMRVIKMQG